MEPKQPSLLRRMTGRSHHDRLEKDEWYIPYKSPAPISYGRNAGVGYTASPPSATTNRSKGNFSFFHHGDEETAKIPQRPSQPRLPSENFASYIQNRPTFGRRSTSEDFIPRTQTHLQDPPSLNSSSGRIPSSTSVPTGLAAPKLLFSPLQRELQGSSHLPPAVEPRQRNISMPMPARTAQPNPPQQRSYRSRVRDHDDPKRWAASSMCDLLVFPRPHIAAHTITPPDSPEDLSSLLDSSLLLQPRVVQEGEAREQEREEWAGYIRRRGTSSSFKGNGSLPRRSSQSVDRKDSTSSSFGGRKRSGSFGSILSRARSSRRPSDASRSYLQVDGVPSSACGLWKPPSSAPPAPQMEKSASQTGLQRYDYDPFRHQRRSELGLNTPVQGHNRSASTPNLLPADDPHQPQMRSRTLRIQQPPPTSNSGVILIGARPHRTPDLIAPDDPDYIQPDFSKPLPALPCEPRYRIDYSPPHSPFKPFTNEENQNEAAVGIAISPDKPVIDIPAAPRSRVLVDESPLDTSAIATMPNSATLSPKSYAPKPARPVSAGEPSSATARAILAKQHQRALTKRAFQSPVPQRKSRLAPATDPSRLSTTSSLYPPSASSYSNHSRSPSLPTPSAGPRRKTALEEAISRSRANSMEQAERKDVHGLASDTSRQRAGSDTVERARAQSTSNQTQLLVPLSPTLAYPISTTSAFKAESLSAPPYLAVPRPPLLQADSAASGVSGYTQYSDASEGWERETRTQRKPLASPGSANETPSPIIAGQDSFQGLFYRTPVDGSGNSLERNSPSYRVVPPNLFRTIQNAGLGFGLEDDSRPESQSDSSTTDIVTPQMQDDTRSGSKSFRYSEEQAQNCVVQSMRPGSARSRAVSSHEGSGEGASTEEFTLGSVRRGQVVMNSIATPRMADNTGYLRTVSSMQPLLCEGSPTHTHTRSISNSTFGPEASENHLQDIDTIGYLVPSPNPINTPGTGFRPDSTAVSFMDKFPSPPPYPTSTMSGLSAQLPKPPKVSHQSAFGQLVTGPPGAGKTTYCHGIQQFCTALGRPIHIVNLDPAVPNPPYPCAINLTSLITLDSVMSEYGLGPNGAMLYCIEYLEANFDWLVDELDQLLEKDGGNGYVVFDTPGQVELWTNHDSLKRMVEKLVKMDYRLASVHLSDAHYITDAPKFISVVLLALRAMLQLELPHVNVLSKIDLLSSYGELPFDLRYYTEAQDLGYLLDGLEKLPRMNKFRKLNRAMVGLVEDYGLVGFETLAVEDKSSMMKLLRQIDKATGYVFMASSSNDDEGGDDEMSSRRSTTQHNTHALFSTAQGLAPGWLGDIDDVQERWGRNKEVWDEVEREEWKKEGEMRAGQRGVAERQSAAEGAEDMDEGGELGS